MNDKCPKCNYSVDYDEDFKWNVLCKYCSMVISQKFILKHNPSNCTHTTDYDEDEWDRVDCEMLWSDYREYYDDIVGEVFS